jgi:serine/threonine protein kinase
MQTLRKTLCGTPSIYFNINYSIDYTAPEVYEMKYNSSCDLYSLGVIIYFMTTKTNPFGFQFDFSKIKDKHDDEYAVKMIEIVKNLTSLDPEKRFSILKIVELLNGVVEKIHQTNDSKEIFVNERKLAMIEKIKSKKTAEINFFDNSDDESDALLSEESILYKIKKNKVNLKDLSPEMQSNKEIVLEAVKGSGESLEFASIDLQNDKEVVLEAVKGSGESLEFASIDLQNDKEIVLEAVKKNGFSLKFASIDLRNDKEVVLEAVKNQGESFDYASIDLQYDKEVVLEAIKSDPDSLDLFDEKFFKDRDVILESVRAHGKSLGFFTEFQTDKEVVKLAVKNYPKALKFAAKNLQTDKEVILEILKNNIRNLENYPEYQTDKEIILELVKDNGNVLKHISIEFQNNKDIVLEAVRKNGYSYEFASPNLQNDKDVVIQAIKSIHEHDFTLKIPIDFYQDKDVVYELIQKNPNQMQNAPLKLLNDEEFMLKCFKISKYTLVHTPYFYDEIFCESLIKNSIENFNFISHLLKSNEEFLLKSLKVNFNIFHYFNLEMKESKEFILKAIELNTGILKYISNDLKNDETFAMELVRINGNCLEYLSNDLRNNVEVVKAAIETTEDSHIFASEEIQYSAENSKKYETLKKIAKGGEGIIYLVKKNDKLFAEKRIKTNNFDEMNSLFNEYSKLFSLDHENIFKIQELLQDYNEITGFTLIRVFMDLYDGDLLDFIENYEITESLIIQFGIEILKGLSYLHSMKMIHGDLKLENIFYLKNGMTLKIGDFGTNISKKYEFYGSLLNIAPELILNHSEHNEKSDIFSFGGILWRMMNSSDTILYISSMKENIAFEDESKFSKELRELVINLLSFDPNNRMNINEILVCLESMKNN